MATKFETTDATQETNDNFQLPKEQTKKFNKKAIHASRKIQQAEKTKFIESLAKKASEAISENNISASSNPLEALKQRRANYVKTVQQDRLENEIFKTPVVNEAKKNIFRLLVGENDSKDAGPLLQELDSMAEVYRVERTTFFNKKMKQLQFRNEATVSVTEFLTDHGINLDQILVEKKEKDGKNLTILDIVLSEDFEGELISKFGKNFHIARELFGGVEGCGWQKYYIRRYRESETVNKDLCVELYFNTQGQPEQPIQQSVEQSEKKSFRQQKSEEIVEEKPSQSLHKIEKDFPDLPDSLGKKKKTSESNNKDRAKSYSSVTQSTKTNDRTGSTASGFQLNRQSSIGSSKQLSATVSQDYSRNNSIGNKSWAEVHSDNEEEVEHTTIEEQKEEQKE